MWHLTKLALRSRVVTILLALAVAGVSVWGFLGLKTELMPDISLPSPTLPVASMCYDKTRVNHM
jgi:HAE1 family hydrophobic/amphiphilic exporter-1